MSAADGNNFTFLNTISSFIFHASHSLCTNLSMDVRACHTAHLFYMHDYS